MKVKYISKAVVFLLALIVFGQSLCYAEDASFKASSVHDRRYPATNAFDGDPKTRWASTAPGYFLRQTRSLEQAGAGAPWPSRLGVGVMGNRLALQGSQHCSS